jgi:hypothetical protein
MAVDKQEKSGGAGRAWVGANVGLMIGLAIILTVGVQLIGYRWSRRADLTSTGVNSLTPATTALLRDLETPVKLTSLYFKTDIEDEDQNRFRSAVRDLIELYRATNRSQITTQEINPLQDHDERKQLFRDLLALPKFKEEAAGHVAAIENFRDNLLPMIQKLLRDEQQDLERFTTLEGQDDSLINQVRRLFKDLERSVDQASQDIGDALASDVPLYSGAVRSIRQTGGALERGLKNIVDVGSQIAANPSGFSPAVAGFFQSARDRYQDLLAALSAQTQTLDALGQLSFDGMVADLRSDTGNALLVQTDEEARVVPFSTVWPPLDPRMPGGARFKDRKFQGEQKLTSAILQLTEEQKPAVIFVRHGGPPLLEGMPMPGAPGPLYRQMKLNLEDANFSVHEWDLAASDEPPAIDPAPSRKLFVVLRPAPTGMSMPGQPPQNPPFTPQKFEALKTAMGDDPRAIFVAGFQPSMGGMAAPYEYADYLRETWGIEADCQRLLLYTEQIEADKYHFVRSPLDIIDVRYADHPLAEGLSTKRATFPLASPLGLVEEAPEGVTAERLVWSPEQDGLWSVQNVSDYVKQQTNEFIVRSPSDYPGDFPIGVVATRGDARMVVVASAQFAIDQVALASEPVLTSQGFAIRPRNPGNVALFMNSLHWLNDNIKWMNLGTPIDTSTLAVEQDSGAMKFVWALSVLILPGLAAIGGFLVWTVRRR